MAQLRTSMQKTREILRLHFLGLKQRQIARSCSIAQSTVNACLQAAKPSVQRLPTFPGDPGHASSSGAGLWATFCAMTGLIFLVAFLSAATVNQGGTNVQYFLNLIFFLEWIWVSSISAQVLRIVSMLRAAQRTAPTVALERL